MPLNGYCTKREKERDVWFIFVIDLVFSSQQHFLFRSPLKRVWERLLYFFFSMRHAGLIISDARFEKKKKVPPVDSLLAIIWGYWNRQKERSDPCWGSGVGADSADRDLAHVSHWVRAWFFPYSERSESRREIPRVTRPAQSFVSISPARTLLSFSLFVFLPFLLVFLVVLNLCAAGCSFVSFSPKTRLDIHTYIYI